MWTGCAVCVDYRLLGSINDSTNGLHGAERDHSMTAKTTPATRRLKTLDEAMDGIKVEIVSPAELVAAGAARRAASDAKAKAAPKPNPRAAKAKGDGIGKCRGRWSTCSGTEKSLSASWPLGAKC